MHDPAYAGRDLVQQLNVRLGVARLCGLHEPGNAAVGGIGVGHRRASLVLLLIKTQST
jgi:hypothetical protein